MIETNIFFIAIGLIGFIIAAVVVWDAIASNSEKKKKIVDRLKNLVI